MSNAREWYNVSEWVMLESDVISDKDRGMEELQPSQSSWAKVDE